MRLPIRYRDFYDIPRAFVVEFRDQTYFFDCRFNPEIDDYQEAYEVYLVPADLRPNIDDISWTDLGNRCLRVGAVPTGAVEFDDSKRKSIAARAFDLLGGI